MRVLVASDAWFPQINGVVRMLDEVARAAKPLGVELVFLTPSEFPTFRLPTYPDIRIAIPSLKTIERRITSEAPDAIHIATEGPIGHLVRRYCVARKLPFTTFFHTRFPEYIAARLSIPEQWTWAYLRRFHKPSNAVMAATPALVDELRDHGFENVVHVCYGVDANLFHPRFRTRVDVPKPVFLFVGRVAIEKNIEAFLKLDLPGTKMVVGDGPLRRNLARRFSDAVFLGFRTGQDLATIYASADVFVFPSCTDTFGLVLLEALASGLSIAAFPVKGPRDVLGRAPIGVLDFDLRAACLKALKLPRRRCREFALEMTWKKSARSFVACAT